MHTFSYIYPMFRDLRNPIRSLLNAQFCILIKYKNYCFKLIYLSLIIPVQCKDIDFVRHTKASQHNALAFKLLVSNKHVNTSDKIILLAATASEKAAWTSDISQVSENTSCKTQTSSLAQSCAITTSLLSKSSNYLEHLIAINVGSKVTE